MRVRGAALTASAATGVTAAVTAANRLGELSVATLGSNPRAVGEGKVWLILTSGLLADRPAVPSLVGFWIVGFAVLIVCSTRVAAGVALGGHSLSALAVYGAIGLTRAVEPGAFGSVMQLADYGLSAMIAAWLGAIACTFWRRHPVRATRLLIVLGSAGCAAIGVALRPQLTFLDSEHLVAYAIGVALADARVRARIARPWTRLAGAVGGRIRAEGKRAAGIEPA
jgi:hypothetical protein